MNMKKIATALIVALVPLLALPVSDARGQYFDEHQLARVERIHLLLEDGVKDGCLPRPDVLKTEAELILRRSGIQVEAGRDSHTLQLTPTGFQMKTRGQPLEACAASLSVELWRFETLSDQSFGLVQASTSTYLFVGPKETFQDELRRIVNEHVSELANEILKARANASSKSQ